MNDNIVIKLDCHAKVNKTYKGPTNPPVRLFFKKIQIEYSYIGIQINYTQTTGNVNRI